MNWLMRLLRVALPVMLLASFGCGKSESTGLDPNQELTEPQKQQVNDLNKQRQEEWGKR
jgi:hypothetical protein